MPIPVALSAGRVAEPVSDGRPPAGAAPTGAKRTAYFDNAKVLAIVLVVCGHFWEPLIGTPHGHLVRALYLFVYTFHMPAFVLMSGYFSRSFTGRSDQLRRLLTGVLVPFLVWGTALEVFTAHLDGRAVRLAPLTPVWVTWFLVSLFLWRLTAPVWRMLRAPVLTATAIALCAGAFSLGSQLSITRTLQFLPFFVIGLTMTESRVQWFIRARWLRIAAVPVLAAGAVVAYLLADRLEPAWLYRSSGAPDLDVSYVHWLLEASALMAGGLVLTAAFLALVPRRESLLSRLGAGTMYAFLVHAFVQRWLVSAGFYDLPPWQRLSGQALLTAGAAALALVLCSPLPARVLRPLVEPRLSWLFVPPGRAENPPGR
ncbi:acyltransferase family protein [Kitasatospora sp. KL5]|uniref:acyltransferase family protein n=1 Tax=Kitasatospora sp. KL5 TaxID=3425125 RepID=UPI003D6F6767